MADDERGDIDDVEFEEDDDDFDLTAPDNPMELLSPRERMFIEAFVGTANFNASKAARMARYSSLGVDAQASRVLARPRVQAAKNYLLNLHAGTAEESLARTARRARATMLGGLRVSVGQDGKITAIPDLGRLVETGEIHNVESITQTKTGFKVKFYNAQEADKILLQARGALKAEPGNPNDRADVGIGQKVGRLQYDRVTVIVRGRDEVEDGGAAAGTGGVEAGDAAGAAEADAGSDAPADLGDS